LADIASYDRRLVERLRYEFLDEAGNSTSAAAELPFSLWYDVIVLYPNMDQLKLHLDDAAARKEVDRVFTERLKNYLQYEAASRPELTRVFYGNAPIIMNSFLT